LSVSTPQGTCVLQANFMLGPHQHLYIQDRGAALNSGSFQQDSLPNALPGNSAATCCADASRQNKELAMSPKTRGVYKAFSHKLRSKETLGKGIAHVTELAHRCMAELPGVVHWRVHLEMADLAKREKNFGEARRLYRLATELQPAAAQTWLEHAKMEEERGHFERCQRILTRGLSYCPFHEALMLKAIKHLERMGEVFRARVLLGSLVRVPISCPTRKRTTAPRARATKAWRQSRGHSRTGISSSCSSRSCKTT